MPVIFMAASSALFSEWRGVGISDHPTGQEATMPIGTLADAKAHLSTLVGRANQGETVQISRRGKVVAQLAPVGKPLMPIDVAALRELTQGATRQSVSAGEWLRRVRDQERSSASQCCACSGRGVGCHSQPTASI
jgi:prevent-host-death family protein